jgi:capsular polysaccharide export protein
MIVFPAEFNARKEAVFAALARLAGGQKRLRLPHLSFRDFPETAERVAIALSRAKRPGGFWKRLLLRGQYNWARRWFLAHPDDVAVVWNGLGGGRQAFVMGARDAGAATLHAELAPFPGRITLDPHGVNAEGSVPQNRGFYESWAGEDPDRGGEGWRAMGKNLTARPSRRADVGQGTSALPETPFLFCPLQVPNDSQVTLFAGWTGGMAGFLAALGQAAQHLPEGWHLRLKEHPSAKASLAPLIAPLLATGRVQLDNATDSFAQLAAARATVVLNSSMGLQAFFHDKPVVTLGRAFFAQSGLVSPAADQAALNDLFADPDRITFDPAYRALFMNWLDRVYYPAFIWPGGVADAAAFAAKLQQARDLALSPRPPMR